ncbi:hypothetical protein ACWOKN_004355 [Vibrio vulnificus]|uniref:hypothetical protein n=1 Tax=Vibrio vulnificus TaxID=672 RepID=UPI000C7D1172|nr:hypothetical protein [Vibrio vulnificus]AUL95764.1 hypothetical protein FORC54_1619 [Vibrio vulnificus]PNG68644.1 hypothetical protein TI06_21800 [Vibrio vulnificus]
MSYALIDNASLTAVERTLGDIVIKNPDTINGDLMAFENLIQAVLFYDDLICVDNYKAEHRETRISKFNFIRFLSESDFELTQLDDLAKTEARQINPEIRGGEFVDDDFKQLVEMLKLNMICTWDLRSSVYYLTMKMLGQPNTPEYEKYSELSASIFNELSDAANTKGLWSTDVKLVSASGHEFTEREFERERKRASRGMGGMTKPLEMFIASLNWMAYKSIYYSVVAKHFKADSFIHPIRHAYQLHWMRKTGAFGHDYTARVIESLSEKISTTRTEIVDHGRTSTVSLDLPIFSAWLANETGNIGQVIGSALELKSSDHFRTCREILREIHIAYDEVGITAGNKRVTNLQNDLDKISGDIKRSYGVPSQQGMQGSFLIKSINSLTGLMGFPALPEREFAISTPDFMKSRQHQAFSTIFKDVTNELTSLERLGGFRDKLASKFVIDDTHYIAPKTENPRFRYASSDWKQPM